ncbi:MAG: hypothetical protein OK422_04010 [Thaumarchaeota archaeon]|nr:hypothetical protein [Nitrososphaerota archaeon]
MVYACIAPHGGEAIPSLSSKVERRKFAGTTAGLRRIAGQMKAAKPDTIVISTPHNLRLFRNIGVVISEYSSGKLSDGRGIVSLSMRARCDIEFAKALLSAAVEEKFPVVGGKIW